ARRPVRILDSRPGGHVREAPAAAAVGLVAVEDDAPPIGHHQVVEAVVVEVADGTAHAEAGAGQADLLGHVGESAVAVVAVQLVGGGGPRAPLTPNPSPPIRGASGAIRVVSGGGPPHPRPLSPSAGERGTVCASPPNRAGRTRCSPLPPLGGEGLG